MNTLTELARHTTIVADTGDLTAIARLKPIDATTNPSLVTTALLSGEHDELIDQVKKLNLTADATINRLSAELGKRILSYISGRVSTEVDARYAYDIDKTVADALAFMELYNQIGVDPTRILIKIAATWQGIKAAEILEKQGVHCNLTLIFTQAQAIACADAGVTLISPFVGRLTDWQKTHEGKSHIAVTDDIGVNSVKTIYQYYKEHGYNTQIMGASFRSTEQILALAGCDLLTIAPALLDELASMDRPVTRILKPTTDTTPRHTPLSQSEFDTLQTQTAVSELLSKGIDGFIAARADLYAKLFE